MTDTILTSEDSPQNFVFLDIDGVLNSTDSVMAGLGTKELNPKYSLMASYALKHADPVSIALVNKLLIDSKSDLVLISSHRENFTNLPFRSKEYFKVLREFLTEMGLVVAGYLSATNILHTIRGKEVDEWMCMAYENGIDVDNYVILDDSNDFLPGQNLVLCDPDQGFTFKNYIQAMKLLNVPTSGILLS